MKVLSLTAFVTLASFRTSSAISNEKNQRKLDDGNGQNFIITHYGLEYYTPVDEAAMQKLNTGYFAADIIPVDVNTGEELKSVKNLYVPLHTGYSIGVGNEDANISAHDRKNEDGDRSKQVIKVFKQSPYSERQSNEKKFKSKHASIRKKIAEDYSPLDIDNNGNTTRSRSTEQNTVKRNENTKYDEPTFNFLSIANIEKVRKSAR